MSRRTVYLAIVGLGVCLGAYLFTQHYGFSQRSRALFADSSF